MNNIWGIAAGGAVGASISYAAIVLLGRVAGMSRMTVCLAMVGCFLQGVVVAYGRRDFGQALIGIGFLGSLMPFTALVAQLGANDSGRLGLQTVRDIMKTLLAGGSMAVLGYLAIDLTGILIEKFPSPYSSFG